MLYLQGMTSNANNMITRGKIKDVDKAYLAGVIDSDGSISVIRSKPNAKNRQISYRFALEITITNLEKELMDWVVDKFGGKFAVFLFGLSMIPVIILYLFIKDSTKRKE